MIALSLPYKMIQSKMNLIGKIQYYVIFVNLLFTYSNTYIISLKKILIPHLCHKSKENKRQWRET